MRPLLITSYLLLITSSLAQVARLPWDVQLDRPVPHDVSIWRGETVDLMPRLVQGTRPVALTNAPVELRYREAALPTNSYRSVLAAANTNSGVLAVRWLPDYDAGAAWYDYQVIVGSNAANPRAFGRITMRGTIGLPGPNEAPPPVTLYPTRADLQSASNALASALQQFSLPYSAGLNSLYYESNSLSPSPQEWFAFDGVDEIVGYTGPEEIDKLVVPFAISGLVVRAIARDVFASRASIASLYLPSSIERMGVNCLANFGGSIGRLPPGLTSVAPYLCDESPYLADPVVIGDAATSIGFAAFEFLAYTTTFTIGKSVRQIHARCFAYVGYHAPCALYWYGDAPEIIYDDGDNGPFYYAGPGVTNYVMNPNAVGWGTEFDGRPVVRVPYEAASKNDLAGLSSAWTNSLLYSASGTNYFPRWDAALSTYVVTGVPQ
jgi:hypothetical protein